MCFLVKIHLDIECFALDLLIYMQKMCFQRHLLSLQPKAQCVRWQIFFPYFRGFFHKLHHADLAFFGLSSDFLSHSLTFRGYSIMFNLRKFSVN
jgi:hypothetical protein